MFNCKSVFWEKAERVAVLSLSLFVDVVVNFFLIWKRPCLAFRGAVYFKHQAMFTLKKNFDA